MFPKPSCWLGMEKLNLTQQKHAFTNPKKCTTTKQNKKLRPGLVAFYDIWPRNGEGLFLFWRFINLSLSYLLRHLPTYLQPRDPHGARNGYEQARWTHACKLSTPTSDWRVLGLQWKTITDNNACRYLRSGEAHVWLLKTVQTFFKLVNMLQLLPKVVSRFYGPQCINIKTGNIYATV